MKSGVINFLKPVGMTSSDAVAVVRKATGCKKAGHLGTLDPLAAGVLPIAVGKATRLFDLFLQKRKRYIAFFDFSYSTDTLDNDGVVTEICEKLVTSEEIEKALPNFLGEISQLPPKYSAKNIDGARAYELARSGKEFEVFPNKVEIFSIELLRKEKNNFVFEIECSAGTYIRSIARDLGKALGALGTMTALIRTKSGAFSIEDSVTKEELLSDPESHVDFAENVLSDYPEIRLFGEEAFKAKNGVGVSVEKQNGIYRLYLDDVFFGAVEIKNGLTGKKTVIDD